MAWESHGNHGRASLNWSTLQFRRSPESPLWHQMVWPGPLASSLSLRVDAKRLGDLRNSQFVKVGWLVGKLDLVGELDLMFN